MRAYFFCNYYLSSIQQGIQSAHCVADMFVKYSYQIGHQHIQLTDWATNHKTMVLLNGGNQKELLELYDFLNNPGNTLPFHIFKEDEQSVNGCATCVGIVLPPSVYEAAAKVRSRDITIEQLRAFGYVRLDSNEELCEYYYSDWSIELIERLNMYGLAR